MKNVFIPCQIFPVKRVPRYQIFRNEIGQPVDEMLDLWCTCRHHPQPLKHTIRVQTNLIFVDLDIGNSNGFVYRPTQILLFIYFFEVFFFLPFTFDFLVQVFAAALRAAE